MYNSNDAKEIDTTLKEEWKKLRNLREEARKKRERWDDSETSSQGESEKVRKGEGREKADTQNVTSLQIYQRALWQYQLIYAVHDGMGNSIGGDVQSIA